MNSEIDIYSFNNYLDYLKSVVHDFKLKNRGPSSLGEWAKRLKYRSPRSFGMILDGKRLPSNEFVDSFCDYLSIKKEERNYLLELIKLQKNRLQGKSTTANIDRLQMLNPKVTRLVEVESTVFSYISKWYHLPLKELLRTKPNFRENYKSIAKQLKNKLSANEVEDGIENLISLGYVSRNHNGTLTSKDIDITTTNDVPSKAIKEHHKGMLELAKQAIDEQPATEREFQAFTFQMNTEDLPEAKQEIRNFITNFHKKFCNDKSGKIYQLNLNIFSHTETTKEE